MTNLEQVLQQHKGQKIALYGLGTETERFLDEWGNGLRIVGLLDGFCEEGELYGYPILSHRSAVEQGAALVLVVARPGSCKAIVKKIGGLCRENGIALFDVRGKDLLAPVAAAYDFSHVQGETKAALLEKISQAEVVSFDLFDTLVARQVSSCADVFELAGLEWRKMGICIPDFARLRLAAEKELSRTGAPTLEMIYAHVLKQVGGSFVCESQLAEMEWAVDVRTMVPREAVCEIFRDVAASGKRVVITTDTYYREEQIGQILDRFGLKGYEGLFVSCERGTSKAQGLFDAVRSLTDGQILHIGDDQAADVEPARKRGLHAYRLLSGSELLDALGGMGIEAHISSLSDRVKAGLFASRMFNDPFWFEGGG